jgi:L,D-transpeptidase catalytic domain
VSSGCIRMRDADVIDLYNRVGVGTRVVVLPNDPRAAPVASNPQPSPVAYQTPQRDAARGAPVPGTY